jgi:hypothetical protein
MTGKMPVATNASFFFAIILEYLYELLASGPLNS